MQEYAWRMLQVALTEEVINPRTSGLTAAAVSLVLLTTLGGNILQRLNNSYWSAPWNPLLQPALRWGGCFDPLDLYRSSSESGERPPIEHEPPPSRAGSGIIAVGPACYSREEAQPLLRKQGRQPRASHHQTSERDQTAFIIPLICTGSRRNLATCDAHQGS